MVMVVVVVVVAVVVVVVEVVVAVVMVVVVVVVVVVVAVVAAAAQIPNNATLPCLSCVQLHNNTLYRHSNKLIILHLPDRCLVQQLQWPFVPQEIRSFCLECTR